MRVIPSKFPIELIINEVSEEKMILIIKNLDKFKYDIIDEYDRIKILIRK